MQVELEKAYDLKTQRVTNRKDCSLGGQVLSGTMRWTRDRDRLEGDPRHAELVVEQLELEKRDYIE